VIRYYAMHFMCHVAIESSQSLLLLPFHKEGNSDIYMTVKL
jgi:hypothetical protein